MMLNKEHSRTLATELNNHLAPLYELDLEAFGMTEKFVKALVDYFSLINDTPELHAAARKITTTKSSMTTAIVGKFYREVQKVLEQETDPELIIISEINKKLTGQKTQYDFPVLSRSNVRVFHDKLLGAIEKQITYSKNRLIQKDSKGNFYYNGQPILIDKQTLYYQVFNAIYSTADQFGFSDYNSIENYLIKNGFERMEDQGKRNKRILNAMAGQGIFRYATVNGQRFINKTLSDEPLIKPKRGKGLVLNNPEQ